MDDTAEISLQQIIELLLKNKLFLFLSAVFGVLIAWGITSFVLKSEYESNVKLYVYAPVSEERTVSQDLNAVNYAQKVVNTYIQMLDTRSFFHKIDEEMSDGQTVQTQLTYEVNFSVLGTTEVFQAAVTADSPEDAFAVAQTISVIAPQIIQEIYETAHLKIVDPPVLNVTPVSPNLNLNLVVGLFAGLGAAALAVLLRDMLDIKIKNATELSDRYGVHVLAEVGDINEKERKSKQGQKNAETFTIASDYREAYRTARTNIMFSLIKKGCKKITVISSLSKEGKTTTSVNIAVALSQQLDVRVLLIDCDLRKPRIHRFFNVENASGLTDYLIGMKTLYEVIQRTNIENLSLICAGSIPPNPSELLASNGFVVLMEAVEKEYDYILMDTSPLNIVSDAMGLARYSDGLVITAVQGLSRHPEFSKTLLMLKNADAKIAGVVLHGVERHRGKKYGKYGDGAYGYYEYQTK
ncbi:MAG: polysaccharide biosynthesis tyrosine autokinase [Clostridiales bacterium]|nr:polysaccharide biosynthesis tyrosine autokinase [Clostridiales bacterium]